MEIEKIIEHLSQNAEVFKSLLKGIEKDMQTWKSTSEDWCLLEIICHLCDEEKYDFRTRTKHILDGVEENFESIDPVGWVTSRNYLSQNYDEKLEEFLAEREASIKWLHSLSNPNWEASFENEQLGRMTAKMFLANWLAHDYLHIRQITRLKYRFLMHTSGEDVSYAGRW